METSLGDIRFRLYDETVLHRENMIKLVREGYYNGMLFHRVIKNFMIQTRRSGIEDGPSEHVVGR